MEDSTGTGINFRAFDTFEVTYFLQQPCRTEQDWEAFWEEHGEEVTKEIEDRTAVDAEVKVEMDA